MIRNNPEYMMEDGSPRYGIRTTGLVAVSDAPPALADIGQTADAAAMLDAAELKLASQHRYILDTFSQDAGVISSLREAHPEELKLAEAAVESRLGSPKKWAFGAQRAYIDTTVDEAEKAGTLARQLVTMLLSSGLAAAALILIVGMLVQNVPPLPFLAIVAGLWLLTWPVRRRTERDLDRVTLPHDLSAAEARTFYDDVVNATFLVVLQNKGIPVDIATAASLTRGWKHTSYVASVAQDLRTNHAASP